MFFPEINSIKQRRLKLGIKQKRLSDLSEISQSMIAKLESGKIGPSYAIAKKLFSVLESLEHKQERKCLDVMTKKIISVNSFDNIEKASDLMKKNSISQLPVLKNKNIVGKISETIIFNKLLVIPRKKLFEMKVNEIMEEPFPIINENMPLSVIFPLLKTTDAILIVKNSKISGIITKSNLL